jgi:hypothetical protein
MPRPVVERLISFLEWPFRGQNNGFKGCKCGFFGLIDLNFRRLRRSDPAEFLMTRSLCGAQSARTMS